MQHLLAGSVWEADLVRDELRGDALEQLVTQDSMQVVDETSFPTLGGKSEGVRVQYCGTSG
jgi:SRSO17 transposase